MPPSRFSRRAVLAAGAGGIAAGLVGKLAWDEAAWLLGQEEARVVTLAAAHYEVDLVDLFLRGVRELPTVGPRVRGARVVVKPNLVEWSADRPINTHPRVVGAVVEALRKLGAASVVVGEGPGHRRDTEALVEHSGLADVLHAVGAPFLDLNVDTPARMALPANFTRLSTLPVAAAVASADLVVSVAKLKTHHWAGATLTMKNLFGTVPGRAFGWPKNPLHWAGISNSVADLWSVVRPGLAVVDGIVGMEGDGPIMGSAVPTGLLVLGESCPAVDATAARLMGLRPERIEYLRLAGRLGGAVAEGRITVVGDRLPVRPFAVVDHFAHLRA